MASLKERLGHIIQSVVTDVKFPKFDEEDSIMKLTLEGFYSEDQLATLAKMKGAQVGVFIFQESLFLDDPLYPDLPSFDKDEGEE